MICCKGKSSAGRILVVKNLFLEKEIGEERKAVAWLLAFTSEASTKASTCSPPKHSRGVFRALKQLHPRGHCACLQLPKDPTDSCSQRPSSLGTGRTPMTTPSCDDTQAWSSSNQLASMRLRLRQNTPSFAKFGKREDPKPVFLLTQGFSWRLSSANRVQSFISAISRNQRVGQKDLFCDRFSLLILYGIVRCAIKTKRSFKRSF